MKEKTPTSSRRLKWFRITESFRIRNLDLRETTRRRINRELAEIALLDYELEVGPWFDKLADDLGFGVNERTAMDEVEEYEYSRTRRMNAWDFSEILALEPVVPTQKR